MRRNTRDELLLGFLAINAMLREDLRELRRSLQRRGGETKYNPNWAKQPRAPIGSPIGGRWVQGGTQGVGGPSKLQRPAPADRRPQQPSLRRLPAPANDNASLPVNDNQPIRIGPWSGPWAAVTLPLALYGDTPRPTVRTVAVAGADDLFLTETEHHNGLRVAAFQRVERPRRRVPAGLLAPITGFETTVPAELQTLPVQVELVGDEVVFDGEALARAYGRDIPGVTRAIGGEPSQFGPITHTAEEADMALAMRLLGRPPQQVQTALDAVRQNRSTFRNNAGIAFSSEDLRTVHGIWLGPTTVEAPVPEQVAAQLRGRVFANADEFRSAFWIAVANSDLASQFNVRDRHLMRLGFAPVVENVRERYGRRRTYIIHHRRTIASGGRVFDMSNMLIVTPSRHQDILPPNEHFVSPARRRRRDTHG